MKSYIPHSVYQKKGLGLGDVANLEIGFERAHKVA